MKKNQRVTFKIYPDNKKLYYEVIVFPNREEMKDYVKKGMKTLNAHGFDERMGGCTLRGKFYREKNGKGLLPCLGIITFCEEWFIAEVISHEMVHATVGYFFRKKVDINIDKDYSVEELFCHIQGDLVQQVLQKYMRKIES